MGGGHRLLRINIIRLRRYDYKFAIEDGDDANAIICDCGYADTYSGACVSTNTSAHDGNSAAAYDGTNIFAYDGTSYRSYDGTNS